MDKRLNIAFVWHMHQPIYKDPFTGEYTLPWVLLHGTKDYYDMAAILDEFPDIHQTFNLVPCLIEQINEYGSGKAADRYRAASLKAATDLTREDKCFILRNFFQANWDNMIKTAPRYWELLRKRGASNEQEDIETALRFFVPQDFLDLQVLFNLVWVDPHLRASDPFLAGLFRKGRGFTEDEKTRLLDRQIQIVNTILPKYAELMARGVIEVSTSPYYHPILPLLCDSFSARESMPGITLPRDRFVHPEDAAAQLRRGVTLYRDTFGREPQGLWPSEGSVSMDILKLVKAEGFKWLATDEEILAASLKRVIRRDSSGNCHDPFLYRPYSVDADGSDLTVIFRDHVLSDLIGFDYAKMEPGAAAADLVSRLMHIHGMLDEPETHLVSIILDGENAWEGFRNDGRDFFVSLYSRLSRHPKLRCATVSEFLSRSRHREHLPRLHAGSWIGHNFKIWIGHPEDNAAWDFISEARAVLERHNRERAASPENEGLDEKTAAAWDALYAAEGSDWFWWYGEEHSSMSDEHFDSLFRQHIRRIYTLIGMEPPDSLDIPISSEAKGFKPQVTPAGYINPVIDGEVSNYFEWLSSGRIDRRFYGVAMHRDLKDVGLIEGISYGFSTEALFFRFDYLRGFMPYEKEWAFTVTFLQPSPVRINSTVRGRVSHAEIFEKLTDRKRWVDAGPLISISSDRVVELGVPFKTLGVKNGDEIRLFINIDAGERGLERWPVKGFLSIDIPPEDFEQQHWIV
jgi:alpha-amylase/alpha-mannosidase (GH57 family)